MKYFMCPGIIIFFCADLHAPKTVRATMGSICRVPFYETGDLEKTLRILKEQGVVLYAAHLHTACTSLPIPDSGKPGLFRLPAFRLFHYLDKLQLTLYS